LLLALISFIAGMAVRRGALNGVMGEQEDSLVAKSAASASANVGTNAPTTNASGAGSVSAPAAGPLAIEIVDTANHHWMIPASTGGNRSSVGGAGGTPGSAEAGNRATTEGATSKPETANRAAGAPPSSAASAATSGTPGVPLVLSLPETPISASGSVAISSQRSVPMPVEGTPSAKSGRNLQVGQLTNLVEPVYPPEAVQQKIEGTVKLHAVIGTDGAIESLAQVSGPQMLVNASLAAVRNWKYSPTRMNGQAIETQEDISFVFRLPN
jgi:TonB family protein